MEDEAIYQWSQQYALMTSAKDAWTSPWSWAAVSLYCAWKRVSYEKWEEPSWYTRTVHLSMKAPISGPVVELRLVKSPQIKLSVHPGYCEALSARSLKAATRIPTRLSRRPTTVSALPSSMVPWKFYVYGDCNQISGGPGQNTEFHQSIVSGFLDHLLRVIEFALKTLNLRKIYSAVQWSWLRTRSSPTLFGSAFSTAVWRSLPALLSPWRSRMSFCASVFCAATKAAKTKRIRNLRCMTQYGCWIIRVSWIHSYTFSWYSHQKSGAGT